MRNRLKVLLLMLTVGVVLPNTIFAQLNQWMNKTHRELATSPGATFRADSLIFHSYVIIDSIISAVQKMGAYSSCNYSTVQAAKTAAVSAGVPLTIPANCSGGTMSFVAADSDLVLINYNTITVAANDTIPAGARVLLAGEGKISISTGVTLYIQGKFEAGLSRAFLGSGTVTFAGTALDVLRPEWWGATNDSTGDSGPEIQSAIDAAPFGSTIKLMPAYGQNVSGSKGYIVNTTARISSRTKQINIEGNGTVIYNSGSDTVLVVQNTTPTGSETAPTYERGKAVISGINFKKIGTNGTGVAIALVNATQQNIRDCTFKGYNNGVLLMNESSGWTEHNYLGWLSFAACDTAILFNCKNSGTASFRNNHLEHIAIPAMSNAQVILGGGQAVGIASIGLADGVSNTPPNLYQNTWMNVSMALGDSCTGVYFGGRTSNIFAQISFENFGGDGVRSRAFHLGPNAAVQGWIYSDFATRGDLSKLIYNESSYAPEHIFTHVVGQTNSQNHGNSYVWSDSLQLRLESVLAESGLDGFSATPGDSGVYFERLITNTGIIRNKIRPDLPLEFTRIALHSSDTTSNAMGPIRVHNIGRFSTKTIADEVETANTDFIQFNSVNGVQDTLYNLIDGDDLVGRKLFVLWPDSVLVPSLDTTPGDTSTGRIFWADNRDRKTQSGMRSLLYSYGDAPGITWREMFTYWPMGSVSWNPAALDSGQVDSTTVTYLGALAGDPVEVGFAGITHSGWEWHLSAYAIADDQIRVYLKRLAAGSRDLASATLRFKIVR